MKKIKDLERKKEAEFMWFNLMTCIQRRNTLIIRHCLALCIIMNLYQVICRRKVQVELDWGMTRIGSWYLLHPPSNSRWNYWRQLEFEMQACEDALKIIICDVSDVKWVRHNVKWIKQNVDSGYTTNECQNIVTRA